MNQNNMTKNKIKLSVIVLFYFGERWIKECIRSLEKQSLSRSAYEIILVDNGGSTPSAGNYEGVPNTKALHFQINHGFAGGNNKALAHAEGEFILLVNQDVVVHFNCLEELITAFEHYPRAGAVSANMLMISSNDHPNRHAAIHKSVGLYKLTRLGYASYFTQETDADLIPVEFVSGNAMCFRRCILNDVGNYLFDARLKSYAEDLDLSIRLKKTKWDMCVRPEGGSLPLSR
jgi:GT2 family glycosyltransferase